MYQSRDHHGCRTAGRHRPGRRTAAVHDRDQRRRRDRVIPKTPASVARRYRRLIRARVGDQTLFAPLTLVVHLVEWRKSTPCCDVREDVEARSEEHTSELQSLMLNSYAVFYLKKKIK